MGMLAVLISAETYIISSDELLLETINHCLLCTAHLLAATAAEVW